MSVITRENDNVYVNIAIPNLADCGQTYPANVVAAYDEFLSAPVIDVPDDYYASVVRFSIPIDLIPLFSFPVDICQNNPNQSKMVIGIENAGLVQFPQFVIYSPQNDLTAPVPGLANPFFTSNQVTSDYYFIYSVVRFITMINTALAAAVVASGIGVAAPYYYYESQTEFISLIVTPAFVATGAKIFMNSYLKNYLGSFDFTTKNYVNTGPYLYYHDLSVIPLGMPIVAGTYQYYQNYNSMNLWFDVQKIIIQSNALPIVAEFSPSFSNPQIYGTNAINSSANLQPILTDYALAFNNISDFSSIVTYIPEPQYRLINMRGSTALSRIQLSFSWLSRNGTSYPLYVSPNKTVSVKLGFFKKSLYKNI